MELNLQIIASDMKDICLKSHFLTSYDIRNLRYPCFYQEGRPLDPTVLYLVTQKQNMKKPPETGILSFLFLQQPPDIVCSSCNCLIIHPNVPPEELLVRLQELFAYYQQWENQLYLASMKQCSLSEFGKLSLKIFDNPIQFYNQKTLNCVFAVADSSRYNLPDSFPSVDENGYMSMEHLLNLKLENVLDTLAVRPMYIKRDTLTLPAIMQDIIIQHSHIGRIIVLEVHKPLDERDMALVMVLTEHIRQFLLHNPALYGAHSRYIDRTLSRLICGEHVKDATIVSALQFLEWEPQHEYFCLTAKLPEYDHSRNSLHMLAVTISSITKSNCFLIHEDSLIFLFNLTVSGLTRDEHLKTLLPVLRDNLLKVGISTPFNDFKQLYNYYKQASIALQTGVQSDPSFWYFRFENYALKYMAAKIYQDMEPTVLCPEGLVQLIKYDRKKDNHYVHILKTYLECNMNISETAKRLYMHRNTLLYKLERIKEILGVTLEKHETRLLLMLALYILENPA